MENKIESGLQLFSRLCQRPSLKGLQSVLFNDGPNSNEIIEITGSIENGRNLLLLDLIARSILPKQHSKYNVGGKDCGVILIDCSHHFNLFKLIEMLKIVCRNLINNVKMLQTSMEGIIEDALKNLIILNCYDYIHFQTTLLNLESLLTEKATVGLVVVDSISSYYKQYCSLYNSISLYLYHSKHIKKLISNTETFHIVVLYTISDVLFFKDFYKNNNVYQIALMQNEGSYEAQIVFNGICNKKKYQVDKFIKFII